MQQVGFALGKRERACCMQLAAHLGKRKGHPPSLLTFIPPLREGCVWVLDISGSYPSFEPSYCAAADSEIGSDGGVISALLLFFLVFTLILLLEFSLKVRR
jgi:hypothetical protein